jgi:hypothetical protein
MRRIVRRMQALAMNANITYKLHAVLAAAWLLFIIPAWYFWRTSLFLVIAVSLYANFVSHWGAYQAVLAQLVAGRAELEAKHAVELVRLQAVEDDRDQADTLRRIEEGAGESRRDVQKHDRNQSDTLARIEKAVTHDDSEEP